MTNDDVLYAYRLRVLASARELGIVAAACRLHGIHRSTYYRWKSAGRPLRPRDPAPPRAPRPQMPNSIPVLDRAAHRRLRPRAPRLRAGAHRRELAREKWGGFRSPPTASTACCAATASTPGPCARPARRLRGAARAAARARARAPHRGRPSRRARADRLLLHRPPRRHQGRRLAVHGDRRRQRLHLGRAARHAAETPTCASHRRSRSGSPTSCATRLGARARHHRQRLRVPQPRFDAELDRLGAVHTLIRPGRPQSNGFVERVQRTILEECWKPAFARYLVPKYMGLRRELERYLELYNFDRTHNGRLTKRPDPRRGPRCRC